MTNSDLEDLKKLVENIDEEFKEIEKVTEKINIFDILKLSSHEIRHSNFLSWLFNPLENHQLDDYFLKKFLKDVINKSEFENEIDIFGIETLNSMNSEIRTEYKNIDILILNEQDKFLCCIENKIYSKEHSKQCQRYREILEKEFPDFNKVYVFLTIDGSSSEDENYISYTYGNLYNVLNLVFENKKENLNNSNQIFIQNYLDILNRQMVEDSDIKKICEDIYKKHKKALDLIIENKPDRDNQVYSIFIKVLEDLIKEGENIELDRCSKFSIKFYPKEFKGLPKLGGYDGWADSKLRILFEIRGSSDPNSKMRLNLVLGGRSDFPILAEKIDKMMKKSSNRKTWSSFPQKDILGKTYREKENDDLRFEIKKKLEEYLHSDSYKKIIKEIKLINDELELNN